MNIEGVVSMVVVEDIERAARFYRDILGLTPIYEQEDLALFQEGVGLQVSPEPLPASSLSLNAVMVTLIVNDVEAAFRYLTERGVAFYMAPQESGGVTIAAFRDTEGNLVQIMEMK